MKYVVLVAALCALVGAPGCGADKIAGGKADGAEIFAAACAGCHGGSGKPDPGMVARYGVKDLTSAELQKRLADKDIRHQVLNGSKNKKMPSFRGALTDAQLDALVKHVRTLRK
jgi:mono/diheme cytochrome c family protein